MKLALAAALCLAVLTGNAHATKIEIYGSVSTTYTVGAQTYPEMDSLIRYGDRISGSFSYDPNSIPLNVDSSFGVAKTYSGGTFSMTIGGVTITSRTNEIRVATRPGGFVIMTPLQYLPRDMSTSGSPVPAGYMHFGVFAADNAYPDATLPPVLELPLYTDGRVYLVFAPSFAPSFDGRPYEGFSVGGPISYLRATQDSIPESGVPEPASSALAALGLLCLAGVGRAKRFRLFRSGINQASGSANVA